jgi:hypothetical protein
MAVGDTEKTDSGKAQAEDRVKLHKQPTKQKRPERETRTNVIHGILLAKGRSWNPHP